MAQEPEVLIAGAGPTGLAAALFLAERGIAARIIDLAPEPTRTSKALGVNPRTLALLANTGVSDAIEAEAQPIEALNIHRKGRRLARIVPDWRAIGAERRMVILPQARTEALLTEALTKRGVTVERGVGVAAVEQGQGGVAASLSDGSAARPSVLFAADGAHSMVRKALNIGFPGDGWEEPWQLIDVDLEGPPSAEGWIDLRPDGPFVCLPFSGKTFRLIGFGSPLLDNLPEGWTAGEVRWRSDFKVSHRMADRMSVGRVCLGGDAAHIHSPLGARGMNLGIEDAFVFAACAADFLQGETGRLEDYGRLRHRVDAAVVSNVRRLTTLARDTSRRADLMRRALLPVVASVPFAVNAALRVGMGLDHPVLTR